MAAAGFTVFAARPLWPGSAHQASDSAWSALLGALVIGSVSNGLDLMAQPPEVKYMVEGAILLAAVTVDALARRSRMAAGR